MNSEFWKMARIVDCLIGGGLMSSAILKAISPAESAALLIVYGLPEWFNLFFIQLEIVLGGLLISGAACRITRIAALVCFVGFVSFSAYRALAGYESCGCFGAIKVHPWITFAVDLMVISCLIGNIRQSARTLPKPRRSSAFAIGIWLLVGCIACCLSHVFQPHRLEANDGYVAAYPSGFVVLEPEKWHGQDLPIAAYFSPRIDISKGSWTVLLYHHNCPDCQAALPYYARLASSAPIVDRLGNVVLVEIPPYGEPQQHGSAVSVRLSDGMEWFVQAPVEIQVVDGVVTTVSKDLPSIAHLRKQFASITTTRLPDGSIALE